MAKAKAKTKKKTTKSAKPRTHRSFRLTRETKSQAKRLAPMPRVWQLVRSTAGLLWRGKWPLAKLTVLHLALLLILALDPFSNVSQLYVSVLLVLFSMADIWLIRQVQSEGVMAIKPALYQGTSQVVPFTLSGLLLIIQMLPLVIGLWLFQIVVVGEIAVHLSEQAIFVVILAGLALLSWYWMATSLLAIYIVTLPGLTPMQAWHTAKPLVEGRRIPLLLRVLLLLVIVLLLGYGCVLITPTDWLQSYNILPLIVAALLPVWHSYMYKLYRALV